MVFYALKNSFKDPASRSSHICSASHSLVNPKTCRKMSMYRKYVQVLMPTNGAWMWCLKWTMVQSLAKKARPALICHSNTGHFWYDMTHALIILSEDNVGIAKDAAYSLSTENLLRMVVMFQGNKKWINSVCPPWQQRIKWHGEDQAHWLQMREWC